MKLAHRLLRAATAAALAATVLAGCSASPHAGGTAGTGAETNAAKGSVHGAGDSPATSTGTPGRSAAASPVATHSVADWPTVPAGRDVVPTRVLSTVMASGYTGQSYLHHLAAAWGLTLGSKEKVDFPGRPSVWHLAGTARPAKGTVLSVSLVWAQDGNLLNIACTATASASEGTGYLHDCARLDHPGADPDAAVSWLDAMTPRVDRAFTAAHRTPIDSPLLRSGPTATYLQESLDPTGTASYMLYTFGAPAPAKR